MRILNILFFAGVILFSFGCQTEEGKGTLEINFKTTYNDQIIPMFEAQQTGLSDPSSITFSRLEFFLSDLMFENGEKLSEVEFINLTNTTTQAKAEEGVTITINDIKTGSYAGIQMGFGLPDAINATTPSDYSSDSPLGVNANYWASWNSYILSKIEGTTPPAVAGDPPPGFLYHSGVDGMLQTRDFNKTIEIIDGQTTRITFEVNAEDLFFKTGSEIDIINNSSTHSGEVGSAKYNLAKKSLSNLADAVEVK